MHAHLIHTHSQQYSPGVLDHEVDPLPLHAHLIHTHVHSHTPHAYLIHTHVHSHTPHTHTLFTLGTRLACSTMRSNLVSVDWLGNWMRFSSKRAQGNGSRMNNIGVRFCSSAYLQQERLSVLRCAQKNESPQYLCPFTRRERLPLASI